MTAPLPILFRSEHLVAVCKPAGLLVHRSSLDSADTQSAAQLLRRQLDQPVHAVHRLDKGTSGVLLFALDARTARTLSDAFESGAVAKTYHAIVRGWPADAGMIDHPLKREDETGTRTQRRVQVQDALTRYKTLERFTLPITDTRPDGLQFAHTRFALVELQPVTGRRHQLRRHMKHIAHPIVGDATHGKGPLNRAVAGYLGISRLWLHASRLEFPFGLSASSDFLHIPPPLWSPHGFESAYHWLPHD